MESLFVCLPIVILACGFYFLLAGPIQQQLIREHNQTVEKEFDGISSQIRQIENYAVTMNSMFITDYSISQLNINQDIAEISDISKQLLLFRIDNALIKSSSIYVISDDSFIINGDGTLRDTNNMSSKDFSLNEYPDGRRWLVNDDGIYMVQEIEEIGGSQSVLVIQIDENEILSSLSSDVGNTIYGFTIEGEKFYQQETPKVVDMLFSTNTGDEFQYGSSRYTVTKKMFSSLSSVWSFYGAFSVSRLFSSVTQITRIAIIISLFAMLGTWLLTRIATRSKLKPLTKMLKKIVTLEYDSDLEDLNYLQEKIEFVVENYKNQKIRIHQQVRDVHSAFINRLVQGRFSYYTSEELLEKFVSNGFIAPKGDRIVSVKLTDAMNEGSLISADERANNQFMVNNVLQDIIGPYYEYVVILGSSGQRVDLYLNGPKNTTMEITTIIQECNQVIQRVIRRYSTFIVSQEITDLTLIKGTYERIEEAYDAQKMSIGTQVIFIDEGSTQRLGSTNPTVEFRINQIIHGINENDVVLIKEALGELIRIYHQFEMSFYSFKMMLQTLHYNVENLLLGFGADPQVIITSDRLIRLCSQTFDSVLLQEILNNNLLEPARETIVGFKAKKVNNSFESIVQYINGNFSDPLLSQDMLADQYEIDVYLFSKQFKKKTGVTYIEYITNLRMERAKELLMVTATPINKISEMVGYQPSYFTRLFKKRIGVTPGDYRKGKRVGK